MALRIVRTDDDPVLRKISKPVTNFDDKLVSLVEDLKETMIHQNGIGIAAVQVGILKRVFLIDIDGDITAFINPKITQESGEQCEIEGCLSLPGKQGRVKRPQKVTLEYQNMQGESKEIELENLYAIAACHEYDHLEGVLYEDKALEMISEKDPEYKVRRRR